MIKMLHNVSNKETTHKMVVVLGNYININILTLNYININIQDIYIS